ncbi:Crp/Fnr family transcriptional regulator [Microvirga vignae]|uniref:Crp/Fnr family transcriptional regulator n=2 Tax=Microvirga vignae TaxID=1225564 RepID=A0A0H1R3G1_9HYPH|nr:Crp/Fnr family transcriptional regulator [Microvirga vignae]
MRPQGTLPTDLTVDYRANGLLAALEGEDFALLEPYLEMVDLFRGQVLYDTGSTMSHVYFPHDAVISLINPLENGTTTEVAVFGREGVLGLLSAFVTREAFGRYVVQIAGTASRISIERLNEVRNARPKLRQLVMNYGEAFMAQTFQRVSCNAVHPVEARCCRWLLRMQDRVGRDTLPLTHEFLAEMLGVQRSTVSTVLHSLQTAGLIRQGRGSITVANRVGLEGAACECYGKIRRVYHRLLPGTYPDALA